MCTDTPTYIRGRAYEHFLLLIIIPNKLYDLLGNKCGESEWGKTEAIFHLINLAFVVHRYGATQTWPYATYVRA